MSRRAVIVIAASIVLPIIIYVGLDWLIESDEEKVDAIVKSMAAAIETQDIDALLADVPADYRYDNLTHDDLRALAELYFKSYGKTTLSIRRLSTNVTGNTAAVNVSLYWSSERGDVYAGGWSTRWRLVFLKKRDAWQVREITPISVGRYEFNGWGRIAGHLGLGRTR